MNSNITNNDNVRGLRVAHNRLATGRLLVATPISLMSTHNLLCGYTVRRVGSTSIDNTANLRSLISEKDKKELEGRALIIRNGIDIGTRIENFNSRPTHPNFSRDAEIKALSGDITELLSSCSGLGGGMNDFERSLSGLTNEVKNKSLSKEGGTILDKQAQQQLMGKYLLSVAKNVGFNVIINQMGLISFQFFKLRQSHSLRNDKGNPTNRFPDNLFGSKKGEMVFLKNTLEAYTAEWEVLHRIVFGESGIGALVDAERLHQIELNYKLNTTFIGLLNWVALFEENPARFIRSDRGSQFFAMIRSTEPARPLLGLIDDPEDRKLYSGVQRVFELQKRVNLGKPISINDYLVARAEYIADYTRAKRVNFIFYSLWEGIKKLQRNFHDDSIIKEALEKAQLRDLPQHRLKLDADGTNTRAQHSPKVFEEEGDVLFQLLFNKRPADLLALKREFHKD